MKRKPGKESDMVKGLYKLSSTLRICDRGSISATNTRINIWTEEKSVAGNWCAIDMSELSRNPHVCTDESLTPHVMGFRGRKSQENRATVRARDGTRHKFCPPRSTANPTKMKSTRRLEDSSTVGLRQRPSSRGPGDRLRLRSTWSHRAKLVGPYLDFMSFVVYFYV